MRILFVGNSFVLFNDLPGLLHQLAGAGGSTLETEAVVAGGMTLQGHLNTGEAVARIRAGDGCVGRSRWSSLVARPRGATRPGAES